MPAVGVDELSGDAHAAGGFAHAALQHVAHAELARDLPHVDRLALVGEGGIARDHEEPLLPRKAGDDVLGQAVRKVILIGIAAHVLERQHRDRRLVRQRQRLGRLRRGDELGRVGWARTLRERRLGFGAAPPLFINLADEAETALVHACGSASGRCRCRRSRAAPR